MAKFFKKSLAIVLTVILMLSLLIPAFAEDASVDKTPVIVVPGVISTPIVDENGTQVLMPDFGNLSMDDYEDLLNTLKSILKLQDSGDNAGAMKKLVATAHNLLDAAACNPDGTSVKNTHPVTNENSYAVDGPLRDSIGENVAKYIGKKNVYFFGYDWRMDIVDIVENDLVPFIDMVKEKTNSKQVKIVAISMGGAVTNTYLTLHGDRNDIKKVEFISAACNGVNFVNDLVGKDIKIQREALGRYFKAMFSFPVPSAFSAVSNYLTEIVGNMVDSEFDEMWNGFLKPYFLNWAAIWELGEHTKQMDKYLDEYNIHPVLKEKIQRYYRIQDNLETTQKALMKKGLEICYVSNYNLVGVPVTSKALTRNTDFLLDTVNTSSGATVADLGKTLGDNYKQKNDDGHNHLSADGIIDASTCLTPEKTWFIKNLVHAIYSDDDCYTKFMAWLAVHDDVTVESNEKYPQFMLYSRSDNTLTPIEKIEIENPEEGGSGEFCSSAITTYSYTQITALGWIVIAAIIIVILILIRKSRKNKQNIEGVLTKEEIKALPKGERKAAKKQNKLRIKEYKKEQKAAKKARKAELKAMPKAERKAAKKADKAQAKADKKQAKIDRKAAKKQAKANKKAAKAAKKAGVAAAVAAVAAEEAKETPAEEAKEAPAEEAALEETKEEITNEKD